MLFWFLTCVNGQDVDENEELLNEDDDDEEDDMDDDDMSIPHLVMCQFDKVMTIVFHWNKVLTMMMNFKLILPTTCR